MGDHRGIPELVSQRGQHGTIGDVYMNKWVFKMGFHFLFPCLYFLKDACDLLMKEQWFLLLLYSHAKVVHFLRS